MDEVIHLVNILLSHVSIHTHNTKNELRSIILQCLSGCASCLTSGRFCLFHFLVFYFPCLLKHVEERRMHMKSTQITRLLFNDSSLPCLRCQKQQSLSGMVGEEVGGGGGTHLRILKRFNARTKEQTKNHSTR